MSDRSQAADGPARSRWRRWLRAGTIDLTPLRRHRDFRLLTAGQAVSFLGSMITYVALPYQVWQLTRSSLAVGLLGLAELGPVLAFGLLGGALADAHDRKRLVRAAELGLAGVSAALAANALLPRPQLWVLYLAAAAMAALTSVHRPALDSMTPRLVLREELPAASALHSLWMNVGMITGPAIGGLLVATAGLPVTYLVDVGSFAVSLVVLTMMRPVPPPAGAERP